MSLAIIGEHNWQDYVDPVVDGERKMRGLVPRDFEKQPVGSLAYAQPFDVPLIPRSDWQSRLAEQKAVKASLKDVRERGGPAGGRIPSRDQDGYGYCWAHSTVSAVLLARAAAGMPYADLSAFAVACIIKNYRNQGGWGGESVDFVSTRGVPTSEFWPQQSTARSNDKPATWENAKLHLIFEWMDLDPSSPQYIDQIVTCLLLNYPIVTDFNWWSHSVCTMALESIDPANITGSFATWILNSWGDVWSENGAGQLTGRRAIPNSSIALRAIRPSCA